MRHVRKFCSKARATRASSAAPRRTVGEEHAGVSRAALWFVAVVNQAQLAVMYWSFLVDLPRDDPLYFSSVPWRLPLLLSMYAYTSLVWLVVSHVDLYLPRVPLEVHQALRYGGFAAVGGGLLFPIGCVGLSPHLVDNAVIAGCTGFVAGLIAGLLVLWMWLVREYRSCPVV